MNEALLREKGYMTSKDAGAILGYTHDYISRLCRQEKMVGIQKGREWFVTEDEIQAFKKRHEVELQEKKIILSKKFSKIRLEAESQKRKIREQSISRNTSVDTPSIKKSIKFVVPRELVAICVLAFLIIAPSIFNAITPISFSTVSPIQQLNKNFEQGIQDTIYAQSTLVQPVASIFAFAPYLADGYWQFFQTVGQLPKETYNTWFSIGNIYLSIYVKQGELIYSSVNNLNTFGASVLYGYELLGQSFVVGARNIFETYSSIFKPDSNIESAKKKLTQFNSDVQGGYVHAGESVVYIFSKKFSKQMVLTYNFFIGNIGMNLYSMGQTTSGISKMLNANINSAFDFDLHKNKNSIRTIRLEDN